MKKTALVLSMCFAVVCLTIASFGIARADTAIGAVFGYPGNVGLSLRFDRTPIGVAWSDDFVHGTVDRWIKKQPIQEKLDWYLGVGGDAGIPLNDSHDFFFAARVPIGLQYMLTPKIETFGEVAAGFQFVDTTDFYWASSIGIRMELGR